VQQGAGASAARAVEQAGAVLLKNSGSGAGSLPLRSSGGPLVILAGSDMSRTCDALAAKWRTANWSVTCSVITPVKTSAVTLWPGSPGGTAASPVTRSDTFTPSVSGPYMVSVSCIGRDNVTMEGNTLAANTQLNQFPVISDTTVNLTAGTTYHFSGTWTSAAPTVTVRSLATMVNQENAAIASAGQILVLANDQAKEGGDRQTLSLPNAQDVVIATAALKAPTSVSLFTSGPVLMPWLNQVTAVAELWNPARDTAIDTSALNLVAAYSALLTGAVPFEGRLPVTFPAAMSTSPMGNNAFWPGNHNNVDLTTSPSQGLSLGFDWYHQANWPVLFPFGFGLTTVSTHSTFTGASCSLTPSSVCLATATVLDASHGVTDATVTQPIYVAPPSGTGLTLQFMGVLSGGCLTQGAASGLCAAGATGSVSANTTAMGLWNTSSNSYSFTPGC
jgi:beta-glucosidase